MALERKFDARRYFSFHSISRYTTSWAANVGVGDIVAQRLFILDESQPKRTVSQNLHFTARSNFASILQLQPLDYRTINHYHMKIPSLRY
jgi:hypothetical protein